MADKYGAGTVTPYMHHRQDCAERMTLARGRGVSTIPDVDAKRRSLTCDLVPAAGAARRRKFWGAFCPAHAGAVAEPVPASLQR